MSSTLVLIYFGRPGLGHTVKTNFITFQTVNPAISSILIFHKRVWVQLLRRILCMIFQEKYFQLYTLLTDHISLSGYLYFLRYWVILIICCPVCDVTNFEINHRFLIKPVFYITKMSGQKCKYLKNEKRF